MELKVKYFSDVQPLEYIGGKSDWIDLRSAETIELKAGQYYLLHLGIGIKLPAGYEAVVVPRSSSFKNWGILQSNSIGVIDETYCGDEDEWCMPIYATRDTRIEFNDRVCQFRLFEHQPTIEFKKVAHLDSKSRGGCGSTGKQ